MKHELLTDNPILMRHVRSRLRAPQGTYLIIAVFLLAACLLWAGHSMGALNGWSIFLLYYVIQIFVLHFAGTTQVAASISQTNDSGILDFHRVAPLTPTATTMGFVLGAPIREYLVAVVFLPFALFCAIIGQPGLGGYLTSTVVLISTTLLFHSLAMTTGLAVAPGKTRGAAMSVALLLVMAYFTTPLVFEQQIPIPGMLTAGPALAEAVGVPGGPPTFFGLALPVFVQSLIYQVPLTTFLMLAAVRRMRSAQAPMYSKTMAVAFLVTVSVLNLGGTVGHRDVDPELIIPIMLYVNCMVSICVTLAITPSLGTYRNCVRRSRKHNMHRPPLWSDGSSNRAVVLAFASVTLAMVQIVKSTVAAKMDPRFWPQVGTTLFVISYFGSATQFFSLKFPRRWKPVLSLFLFLFWLLPPLVGALVGATFGDDDMAEIIASLSPLWGIGMGTIAGLIWSFVLAGIFYGLMIKEERRCEGELRDASLVEFDAEAE